MEQMQPSPTERQQWEPLIRAVPLEVADSFTWTGSNGTVQSYQQESTQDYLHIDGQSGQFYDRDKNAISPTLALDRALPDEFRHQIQRSEEPSISQVGIDIGAAISKRRFYHHEQQVSDPLASRQAPVLRIAA